MPSPHDSPSSSALGFPCLPVAPGIRDTLAEHLLSAEGSPAPSLPGPGGRPLEMTAAWECGWGALGPPAPPWLLQDRGLSVDCWVLSRAQTHDWTSENAAHYPTHRAQRGHAGARQARRPGWVHGGPGPHPSLPRPLHRGQACARSRRGHLTRRNENHFLRPRGETKTDSNDQGLVLTGKGRPPLLSSETRPSRSPSPPHSQGAIQWRQGRVHSRTPKGVKPPSFPWYLRWGSVHGAAPAAPIVCNLNTLV